SPLAAALTATEQDLAHAQAQLQDAPNNGQVRIRVNNYQTRLAWLKTLKQLEPTLWAAATAVQQPAVLTSQAAMIYLSTIAARKDQQTIMPTTKDQTLPPADNYLPIAPNASAAQVWRDVPEAHFTDPA